MRLFPILYSFIITFFLTKHKCFTAFSLSVYRFFSHIKRAVFSRPFHSSCPSCPSCSAFTPSLRLIPFGDLFFFRQFAPPFSSLSPYARASFSFLSSPIRFFLVLAFFLSALLSSPVLAFPVSPLSVPDLSSLCFARLSSHCLPVSLLIPDLFSFTFRSSCSSRPAPFFAQSFSALSEKIQNPSSSPPYAIPVAVGIFPAAPFTIQNKCTVKQTHSVFGMSKILFRFRNIIKS